MLKVDQIIYGSEGKKMTYGYEADKDAGKYFNPGNPFFVEYPVDISNVPKSINYIPLLANIVPISWFAGFDIYVDEIDETFYNSLNDIKYEFYKTNPRLVKIRSQLKYEKLIKNYIPQNNKTAMLFSGGVDAHTTYLRHSNENPDLITIHGADIDLKDQKQWRLLTNSINEDPFLLQNKKYFLSSNLRMFYSYKVDLLLNDLGWWGKVQHGLALLGLLAPLSYNGSYRNIYIASSLTDAININWGSSPETDNKVAWANLNCVHDGYELKRQDKIDYLVSKTRNLKQALNLRVCYSELNRSFNCSKCEKCFRTIFGLILSGANPNNYGFNVTADVYNQVLKFLSKGFEVDVIRYFWSELKEKALNGDSFYFFDHQPAEKKMIQEIADKIEFNINLGLKKKKKLARIKHIVRNRYPKLFDLYLTRRQRMI